MTSEKDLVLIHFEGRPLAYARVESIAPDIKKNWYHVKLLILQDVPPRSVTWILKDVYIDGEEYTMDGKRMRLEKIVSPDEADQSEDNEHEDPEPDKPAVQGEARVINLMDRMKK